MFMFIICFYEITAQYFIVVVCYCFSNNLYVENTPRHVNAFVCVYRFSL